ncbi:hypothetical protein EVAR_10903_1 [Eumeta japonica]|uniref:Uncharacterized protein n=1 Tax=Eumeta variegata TaxID=151549 RepID=A0A4C1UST4_EUMVA|nr:hypothetical protein EVAR_10903_1 [Eumeta japonica]
MFASKAFALVLVAAACQAVPVWDGGYSAWPRAQAPSVSFGFGSGHSIDVGGIRHSSGIGAAYQSGPGRAVGTGFGAAGGNTYAQGTGIAQAGPTYAQHQPIYNNHGSAAPAARNFDYGPSFHSGQHGSGLHYNSATAAAERTYGGNTAIAAAQNRNGASNHQSAVSFAHNAGGVHVSAAEAQQHRGGQLQHAGASSINSPGLQVAHAHAINAGGHY